MHKKLISLLLAVCVLASCMMILPVSAAGEALTDIQVGGTWAEREVVSGADFLASTTMPEMGTTSNVNYDKATATAHQKGYNSLKFADFTSLRMNDEDNATLEIMMDVTMPMNPADIFAEGTTNYTEFVHRFTTYIDGAAKGTSSGYYGLNVRYNNGKVTLSYPRGSNTRDYVKDTTVAVKYVIEKKDGIISATNYVSFDGRKTWLSDPNGKISGYEGDVTGLGILYGLNNTPVSGSLMKWAYSNASVVEKAISTARISDISKEFYEGTETVPVEFVLPKGYESATLTVGETTVATFDSGVQKPNGYIAKLNLGALTEIGILDVVLSGTIEGEPFSASTTVKRGVDPNYVPPVPVPAKVTFQNPDGTRLNAIAANATVKAVADESMADKLLILGLYQDKVLKAIKSGTGEVSITVPATVDGTKASLKAFFLNSYDDANMLIRAGQWNSSDPTLAELKISGKALDEYKNDQDTYDVELPASISGWPVIDPVANDSATSAVVTHSGKFPGTTTVALKAEDGTSKNITLNWTQEAPAVLNVRNTPNKTIMISTLEGPKFKNEPTKPLKSGSTNEEYAIDNIKNPIYVHHDRASSSGDIYWIASVPEELEGATMLRLPYDSSMWTHSTAVHTNHKLISFELNRSATVYVYAGNGLTSAVDKKVSTWTEDNGWTKGVPFDGPIVLQKNTKINKGPKWTYSYYKHFEVAPWDEPVTVDIGCINWSTNMLIVKFD